MDEPVIGIADMVGFESDAAAIVAFAEARTTHDLRPVAEPVEGVSVFAKSKGLDFATLDSRATLPAPARARGVVTLHTPESFVEWVEAHKGDTVEVYADAKELMLVAILNPGTVRQPGWLDYRAETRLHFTPEWTAWRKLHGSYIEQIEFGHFIADWAHTFVEPAALDVADLARDLTILSNARVANAINLRSGERRLVFEENDQTVDASGNTLDVPGTFELRFPIFQGGEPVDLEAAFRYKRVGGSVSLGVHFTDVGGITRRAFESVTADVAEGLGVIPYMGVAPWSEPGPQVALS